MLIYLILLVMSVYLGTEFMAIATPVAQLTLYRALIFCSLPLFFMQWQRRSQTLIVAPGSYASFAVLTYLIWWVWAFMSVIWIWDLKRWLQAMFLLSLGVGVIVILYLGIHQRRHWFRLIQAVYVAMSGLVLLGYFEILTNQYFFADLAKLDKYRTFQHQPWTRIPITVFENQNDYAMMLLAYITVAVVLYHSVNDFKRRLLYLASMVLASFLIYQSGSRMILLCLCLYLVYCFLGQFRWQWRELPYKRILVFGLTAAVVICLWPALRHKLMGLWYRSSLDSLSGDVVRVNLIRSGLLFFAETFGLGVGAGNLETWFGQLQYLPTHPIVNMHNWWFELLAGYGWLVFSLYVLSYGLILYRLHQLLRVQAGARRQQTLALTAFLWVYILASMTSASMMLIEWHWSFMGLIIAYVKLYEPALSGSQSLPRSDLQFDIHDKGVRV